MRPIGVWGGRVVGGATAWGRVPVLPVEGDPAVAAAIATWNQNPCSPDKANAVVRTITSLVGPITNRELVEGLLRQAMWIAIGAIGVNLMWRRGVKAYTAVNG